MTGVFISYVREDSEVVDQLVRDLKAQGVQIWLDREQVRPGARWKDAIRCAIREGDFFLACFSNKYLERPKTHMNEELTLAIEELRQRSVDQEWFIPIRLSDCQIPDRSIGAGDTLRSLQWVDLYREWNSGIDKILSVIGPESTENNSKVSAVDRAKRVARDIDLDRKRKALFFSVEGVRQSYEAVKTLFMRIENLAQEITSSPGDIEIKVGYNLDTCVLRTTRPTYSSILQWQGTSTNSLLDAELLRVESEGGRKLPEERDVFFFDEPREVRRVVYKPHYTPSRGWCWTDLAGRELTHSELANDTLFSLVGLVEENN